MEYPFTIFNDNRLNDIKPIAKKSDFGATGLTSGLTFDKINPIDFIFVSDGAEVDRYKIIDEKIAGIYLSDHVGLCADIGS